MNPHPLLEKCVNGLLNHSLQAGVLVLLVLFVQFVCKRQLASRWRFALWWIVLLRLALPVNPPSAISLFNLFQPTVGVEGPRYYPPPVTPKIQTAPSATISPETKTAVTENQTAMAPLVPIERPQISSASVAVHTLAAPAIPHHSLDFDDCILPGLAALWAAGALALSGCVVIQLLRFRKKLSGAQVSSDSTLLELLRDCSRELKVSRKIELVETEAVTSPALCGLFKIRLLLPHGLAEKFSARELRHIFLHELAHVQRGDLWLNWLVTALQIVHWFNPLVWLGFARLRADRELACDELALVRAGESEGISYGQTIIKLLEGLGRPATIPGLIGILEDKQQMRRRISMIANFRQPGRWSALAVVLIVALAATALTNAQTEKSAASPAAAKSQSVVSSVPAPISDFEMNDLPDSARPNLIGTVHAKGGAPLAASVFIATAAPKTGTSVFCPSCYTDCRKSAPADTEGNFKIESLKACSRAAGGARMACS